MAGEEGWPVVHHTCSLSGVKRGDQVVGTHSGIDREVAFESSQALENVVSLGIAECSDLPSDSPSSCLSFPSFLIVNFGLKLSKQGLQVLNTLSRDILGEVFFAALGFQGVFTDAEILDRSSRNFADS